MTKSKTTPAIIAAIIIVLLLVLGLLYWMFTQQTEAPEDQSTNSHAETAPTNAGDTPAAANEPAPANAAPTNEPTTKPAEKPTAPAAAEDEPEQTGLKQYDQQVYVFSSGDGKVNGTAGLTFDPFTKKLDAVYNFYLVDGLDQSGSSYYYVGALETFDGHGAADPAFLSSRFCDIDAIGDPFGHYFEDAFRCGKFGETDHFYITMSAEFDSFDKFLALDQLALYATDSYSGEPADGISGAPAYSYALKRQESSKKGFESHPFMQR